jgi:fructose/tagatose bisphosphate aldolase
MEFAKATQAYWEKEKDAIAIPDGMNEDDYTPDKKRFDPRKWIIHAENSMQAAVEDLVKISGSAGKSILI